MMKVVFEPAAWSLLHSMSLWKGCTPTEHRQTKEPSTECQDGEKDIGGWMRQESSERSSRSHYVNWGSLQNARQCMSCSHGPARDALKIERYVSPFFEICLIYATLVLSLSIIRHASRRVTACIDSSAV